MSELDKLIEAVEAGTLTGSPGDPAYPAGMAELIEFCLGHGDWENVALAHDGSLNAAQDLHEALLPGWEAMITLKASGGAAVVYEVDSRGNHRVGEHRVCETQSTNPARAWLLAILLARRADSERE